MSTTESRRARRKAGLHPWIIGLDRLFKKNGYTVYTNDAYTSGIIECPSGHADHWIRYGCVKGCHMRFAFDAPGKIAPYIKRMLSDKVGRLLTV
jgi:hypothetical protein